MSSFWTVILYMYMVGRITIWQMKGKFLINPLIWMNWKSKLLPYGPPLFCLFVLLDSLRPINNLSVKQGLVFLGWTSTKLGLMFLFKDTAQWRWWGLNLLPLGLELSILPLSSPLFCKYFCSFVYWICWIADWTILLKIIKGPRF